MAVKLGSGLDAGLTSTHSVYGFDCCKQAGLVYSQGGVRTSMH